MTPADLRANNIPFSNVESDFADQLSSSNSPPEDRRSGLDQPRVRTDLHWTFASRSLFQNTELWIAFDPVTRHSYRFGVEEHWLIGQMRGKATLRQLCERFACHFPGKEFSIAELQAFCQGLRVRQLLCSTSIADWRKYSLHGGHIRNMLNPSNWVSWRARGLNLDPLLAWLAPRCGWLFSPLAVRFWSLVCLATLVVVLLDFPRLNVQTSGWNWLDQPTLYGSLFVVFLLTRALHELGHAIVCKRFGVRCPDLGAFIVLGAPCVYCDVTESWRLPAPWQRAAVAAAGMYVELIVAALASLVWLATVDGMVNIVALQTMLICSVSTLLININPLMRFDGYYILSDLTNEANLRTRADEACLRELYRWLIGQVAVESKPRLLPALRRRWMIAFSAGGWFYRASLTLIIATVLVALYESWNLAWLGKFLAVAVLITWWGVPMFRLTLNLIRTARHVGRSLRLLLIFTAIAIAASIAPIPNRKFAAGWVQPRQASGLFAPANGQLVRIAARDGQSVAANEVVFQIQDYRTQLVALSLDGAVRQSLAQLKSAQLSRYFKPIDVPTLENSAQSLQNQLEHARNSVQRLTLTAATSGRLLAMPATQQPATDQPASLPQTWTDASQLGRAVAQGTMLGAICSDDAIAVVPLDNSMLASVAAGTEVRMRVLAMGDRVFHSRVESVVQLADLDTAWRLLSTQVPQVGGATNSSASTAGTNTVRTEAGFAAIISLPDEQHALPGSRLQAAFVLPSHTGFQIASHWCHENLRWLAD